MKIVFRVQQVDSSVHFVMLIEGVFAGKLCLRIEEFRNFVGVVATGTHTAIDEFRIEIPKHLWDTPAVVPLFART